MKLTARAAALALTAALLLPSATVLEETGNFPFSMETQSTVPLLPDSLAGNQRSFLIPALPFDGDWYLSAITFPRGDFVGRIITAGTRGAVSRAAALFR